MTAGNLLYETLLESIGEAVIGLDPGGRVIVWNAAAERLYGWSKAEALGRDLEEFMRTAYHDPTMTHARARATVTREGIWRGKVTQARKDGAEVIVDATVRLYHGPDGRGGLIAVNRDISAEERLRQTAAEKARRLDALSKTLIRVQERERALLAREFHDEIGQALTAVFLNLRAMQAGSERYPPDALDALGESMEITSRLMEQVRAISLELHPKILEDLGFVPALRWLINRTGKLAGLRVHFEPPPAFAALPREREFELFRIAQEALTNVLRHARASNLHVELLQESGQTTLCLADDGAGFQADFRSSAQAPAHTFGLHSMFARAELAGMALQITARPGQGTVVKVACPHDSDTQALSGG